MVLKFVLNL